MRKRTVRFDVLALVAIAALLTAFADAGTPSQTTPKAASRGTAAPALLSPATAAIATAAVLPPGFDALVARAMKTFAVPGMGIAVVKDG
ncbi:MAG: hypothetical protein IMZ57_06140, partial [Acidobacteria bacterium]|nr:hypothetical protein [Acidobacteriota bacterium]